MHSIIQGVLIPGGRSLKRDRQSVFFTAVNPMYASQDLEKVQYNLDKPRITVYKITWRIQRNTVFWCNLKIAQRKGLQFYQTQSHAIALFYLRFALRKWFVWRLARIFTAKVHQSPRLPRVDMDDTILLISKRENPPTIKANRASSTGKLVAHISKTHITNILKKITGLSTMKLVAVTLITEFKVYLTQQSKKNTIIARKS